MRIWIGTSGYSYSDWVGSFYPAGTRPGRMLDYYCRQFPLVELNFTFYRPPTPSMLGRLADHTPEGFQFLVKLPRTLSHDKDPKDLPAFRQAVEEIHCRGRLLGLLCQLPQATHDTPQHRNWLSRLGEALGAYQLAVEFRHRSWDHAETPAWLAERKLNLVSVDVPELPGLYPRRLVQSSRTVYLRMHSRNALNWYRSDKDRYDYDYDDEALADWIRAVREAAAQTDRVFLLFNNCQRGQAAANAERMRELLNRMTPEWEVVNAFASPPTRAQQRSLFD
jgi:uncharacterized protein YecE (DUF72 family)